MICVYEYDCLHMRVYVDVRRDVHVIELLADDDVVSGDASLAAAAAANGHVSEVLVDVTARSKRTRGKDLYLILKSLNTTVLWKIVSEQQRGLVHIVVSASAPRPPYSVPSAIRVHCVVAEQVRTHRRQPL